MPASTVANPVVNNNNSPSLQVKKGLSPRRKIFWSRSPEKKPMWKTLLSIFIKNFVLLLALFGLFQMNQKLAFQSGDSNVVSSEIDGRIAEVEKLLGRTQLQVESEISGLRREITEKVEDKGVKYETELKKLEAKADELGNSFRELKGSGILTKEDFDSFLDDIKAFAKEIVEKEIEKHAADGLGTVDYALASAGGLVLDHSEPFMDVKGSGWLPEYGVHPEAQRVLEPSFGEPGKCFPFKGRYAHVVIKLRTAIIPEAVTVEHVAKSVVNDRSTAPKDCRVSGWYANGSGARQYDNMFMLSEFVYDLDRSNVQTFKVDSGEKRIVNTVRFDFNSNHGAANMCIYRLRVHGHVPDSVEPEP